MNNLVVRFVAASVLAVAWIIAWQQILYASELPGEGFSASILTLLAVLLQFVVLGHRTAVSRLPVDWFFRAMGAGLALLLGLMVGPIASGKAIFTSFKVPVGPYAFSSTTLFDVALFLVVTGAMLTAFVQLHEPEEPPA